MSLERDVFKCPFIIQQQLCKDAWEQLSYSTELSVAMLIFLSPLAGPVTHILETPPSVTA